MAGGETRLISLDQISQQSQIIFHSKISSMKFQDISVTAALYFLLLRVKIYKLFIIHGWILSTR